MWSSHLFWVGLSVMGALQVSHTFLPTGPVRVVGKPTIAPLFSTTEEEKKTEKTEDKAAIVNGEEKGGDDPDVEGLPWWWELVWKLDIMKKGEPGQPIIFGDSANVLTTNIEQIYGGYDSLDGCPLAGTKERIGCIIIYHVLAEDISICLTCSHRHLYF